MSDSTAIATRQQFDLSPQTFDHRALVDQVQHNAHMGVWS